MPKLTKYSLVESTPLDDLSVSFSKDGDETESQDHGMNSLLANPVRMKHDERIKLFDRNSNKRQKKQQQTSSETERTKEAELSSSQLKENSQINSFMAKFTDNDDDIDITENLTRPQKRKSQKQQKKGIKTTNKMFSYEEFQHDVHEQEQQETAQYEDLTLEVEKKGKKQSSQLLDRFKKKAVECKNKLDYKDLHKNHIYKKNMQDKLKEIKEVEEVIIVVEVPKLFSGKRSEIEAALFLKNNHLSSTQEITHQGTSQKEEGEEQLSACNVRRNYFQKLGKDVRMNKTQTMTESVLKERFRKSMLDDRDYIEESESGNIHRGNRFDERSQSDYSKQLSIKPFQQKVHVKEVQVKDTMEQNTVFRTSTHDKEERKEETGKEALEHSIAEGQPVQKVPSDLEETALVVSKSETNADKKDEYEASQTHFPVLAPIIMRPPKSTKPKPKQKRQNIKKKTSEFQYKSYIDVEAELSDDEEQNGPKHRDDEESGSDDDSVVNSLIDDDAEDSRQNVHLVHQKYIEDVISEEDRMYQLIRKKIERRYVQEDQKLKKRMEEAANKNKERDGQEREEDTAEVVAHHENSASIATSNSTAQKKETQIKLKELEEMLGGKKIVDKEQTVKRVESRPSSNNLEDLEKVLYGTNKLGFIKVERKGFKNAQKPKKQELPRPKPAK